MKRRFNRFRLQAFCLFLVILLDGAALGTAFGVMHGTSGTGAAAVGSPSLSAAGVSGQPAAEGRELPAGSPEASSAGSVVALTFDDGPHREYTARLLDGLKARNVKATFFLMGQNISGNEELVKRMQQEGHLIGNHSYCHVELTKAGEQVVCQAVEETEQMISDITGSRPQYLRPPYGAWNDTLDACTDLNPVFWSVDSLDWKLQNTDQIVRRVLDKVKNGDVILMHDIFPTSVEAALQIVDALQAEGYQFVTVDELLID